MILRSLGSYSSDPSRFAFPVSLSTFFLLFQILINLLQHRLIDGSVRVFSTNWLSVNLGARLAPILLSGLSFPPLSSAAVDCNAKFSLPFFSSVRQRNDRLTESFCCWRFSFAIFFRFSDPALPRVPTRFVRPSLVAR